MKTRTFRSDKLVRDKIVTTKRLASKFPPEFTDLL